MRSRRQQFRHRISALKVSRRERGMNRRKLASLLGLSDTNVISRWETRRRIPTLRHALLLAYILDRPVERIFEDLREDVIAEFLSLWEKSRDKDSS